MSENSSRRKNSKRKKYRINPKRFIPFVAIVVLICVLAILAGCSGGDDTEGSVDGENGGSQVSSEEQQKSAEEQQAEAVEQARKAQLQADADKGFLILVNKEHSVASDYKPDDLAPINYYVEDRSASCRFMRSEAADQFHKLVEAAKADGLEILMTTAYRSYDFQTILWNNSVASKGSEEEANKTSARPGESEHQTGLAVDISTAEVGYSLTNSFGDTEAGKWVAANAHKYGFILRYLENKTDITGYVYEPWHIRYVGTTAAQDIYEQGITLEEYLS